MAARLADPVPRAVACVVLTGAGERPEIGMRAFARREGLRAEVDLLDYASLEGTPRRFSARPLAELESRS